MKLPDPSSWLQLPELPITKEEKYYYVKIAGILYATADTDRPEVKDAKKIGKAILLPIVQILVKNSYLPHRLPLDLTEWALYMHDHTDDPDIFKNPIKIILDDKDKLCVKMKPWLYQANSEIENDSNKFYCSQGHITPISTITDLQKISCTICRCEYAITSTPTAGFEIKELL